MVTSTENNSAVRSAKVEGFDYTQPPTNWHALSGEDKAMLGDVVVHFVSQCLSINAAKQEKGTYKRPITGLIRAPRVIYDAMLEQVDEKGKFVYSQKRAQAIVDRAVEVLFIRSNGDSGTWSLWAREERTPRRQAQSPAEFRMLKELMGL